MVLTRKMPVGIAAVAAALLAVSACSSSGGNTASSGGASPAGSSGATSPAAAPGTPIKVGLVYDGSGSMGAMAAAPLRVAKAWAQNVNDNGGVSGHPVELIEADTQSQAAVAVTAVTSMVAKKPTVILDASQYSTVWAKVADSAKVPVVGGAFNSGTYTKDANFYPSGQTEEAIVQATLDVAKQAGVTKLAHVYCAESPVCQEGVPLIKEGAPKVGIDLVYVASIAGNAPNFTAQCVAAKQAGADGLWVGHSVTVAARVAADCQKQGLDVPSIYEGVGYSNLVLKDAALSKNFWASFPILPPFSTEQAVNDFNAIMNKYSPGLIDSEEFSTFAMMAYTGGLLIEKAIELAGVTADKEVAPTDIEAGLHKVKDETLGGISPTLDLTGKGPYEIDCFFTGKVVNGNAEQVGGMSCPE